MVDAISGQVQIIFTSVVSSLPHIKAARLRVLAVTGSERYSAFPRIPTVAESGVTGYRRTTWYGLLVPSRTPDSIVARLGAEISKAVNLPDIRQRLLADGAEPVNSTSKQFGNFLVSETALAKKIMLQAGAQR
jgi:tripartite-type tricarboxylate transporter receptor subunit TctC